MRFIATILIGGFVLLGGAPSAAVAQNGRIIGLVTDQSTGNPLPGANVQLVELGRGAATNPQGRYELTGVPPGDHTLRVSFVGYLPEEERVTVGAGETVTHDVALALDVTELGEVVVTALGIEREVRSLGYAVQAVEGAALADAATSNVVNALAAKTAGVQVTSSSGQPGKAARIVIRGNSSLLGENQPLFVVDGVPISNEEDQNPVFDGFGVVLGGGTTNRGLDLDPNIIEDVSVLKGASATALYGSRAANGAIIITTKSGTQGQRRPRITLSSKVRFDETIVDGFQDQYLQGRNGFYLNGIPEGRPGSYIQPGAVDTDGNPITSPTTGLSWGPHKDEVPQQVLDDLSVSSISTFDPRDDFFRTGAVAENFLSISGGTDIATYYLSASDLRQEGTVQGTNLDRTSLLAKFGMELNDRLRAQTSVNYVRTDNNFLLEGNNPRAYWFTLMRAPISYDLEPATFEDGEQRVFSNSTSFNNPYWLTDNQRYGSTVDRFITNASVSYTLFPWLTLRERIGLDTYNDRRKEEVNVGHRSLPTGSMFDQKITRTQIDSDFTLNIDRALTDDVRVTATLGNNINSRFFQYNLNIGEDLGLPGFYNIANASTVTGEEVREEQRLISAYGQATADYRDMVYLTLTGRNDWSSTLPTDNNSYFYPSASVGFVFSEAFRSAFERTPFTFGKLRASVAQIGSDAPAYALSTVYLQANPGDGERGNINFPFNGRNGFLLNDELGNPALKPEISTEVEVGLDLRLLGERARFDAAYYTRTTKDQIFEVDVSPATGFNQRLINAGEVKNYGWEVTLGGLPVVTPSFEWDLQLNWSKNTTEVVELAEGVESIFLLGFTSPQIRAQVGKDGYGVIWSRQLLRNGMLDEPFEGVGDNTLIIGGDGLPEWTGEDGNIGNTQPDWLANLRTRFAYKGLSLSALFDMRQGGDVLNFDLFYSVSAGTAGLTENRGETIVWDGVNATTGAPNTVEVVQDQDYYRDFYSSFNSVELFVEDGSFIKLRELSLSYALPARWTQPLGLQSARITGTGRNLWIDSDFTYRDPEGNLGGSSNGQGFYHGVTPGSRSYSVGVNLTF
ncbi:MAG: SusC/RagA family TonB-linked outer membrane protein [Bacteroidetes bacterium]|jgi:TonB-linked SusC/RagA family outer membrane protein|nr:SusC/RagA family TonB-linked outer membrane protein [Bacteroidota bacterium]